jgi:hypothetical protein
MKRALAFFAALTAAGTTIAGVAHAQSDFYIRSQYSNGTFTGFHEILTKPKEGYYQAQYCDRTFWVSSNTVIWTEEEAAAGRNLVVEENVGSSRTPVCTDYTSFATLESLGLKKKEIEQIRRQAEPLDMQSSRIRIIRDAFKQFK